MQESAHKPPRSLPHTRLLAGRRSPYLRLVQYRTALRAWCKQCLPGRRKPDVRRCHPLQQRKHNVLKSTSQAVLVRMWPIIATHRTPHGASRLVQAISVWSVKPRRAPPRQCSGGRVYGHSTTAMHDNYTPPCSLRHTAIWWVTVDVIFAAYQVDYAMLRPGVGWMRGSTIIHTSTTMRE